MTSDEPPAARERRRYKASMCASRQLTRVSRAMKVWRTLTLLLMVAAAVCVEAGAQGTRPARRPLTRGWEKVVSFRRLPGLDCYAFRNYAVIEEQDKTAVGNNILVKYLNSPSERFHCAYVVSNSDFEIRNRIGNGFLGLVGDLLFIQSSTGANADGLAIYNLSLRKKVYDTGIADDKPVGFVGPRKVTLWEPASEATEENCPQYRQIKTEGMVPMLEEKYTLSLVKFTLTPTGQTHCSAYE